MKRGNRINMNIVRARKIHCTIASIAELASSYNARFGTQNRINDNSPAEAVEIFNQFMAEQANIARLLDAKPLSAPYLRWEKWWESRDVMNIGLVNELAAAALRLVEHLACLEAMGKNPDTEASVCSLQEAIAGMLHPQAREQGQNSVSTVQEAV
jgi:hypothetical protein